MSPAGPSSARKDLRAGVTPRDSTVSDLAAEQRKYRIARIPVADRSEFASNAISTAKYNCVSYIPVSLFDQCVAGCDSTHAPTRVRPRPSRS